MKKYFQEKEAEMLELLEKLVNIESGTYVKGGTNEVGKVLQVEYEKLGFICQAHEQDEVGSHLQLQVAEKDESKILIVAHMDTVFPEGTVKERPFTRDETKAYGPGVVDMQASLVTVLYALKALKETGDPSYKNVQVLLNSDEEISSIYSRPLIEALAKQKDYALIVEPSRGAKDYIVTGRKGICKFTLKATGIAAHSGVEPQKGASAILELANKITEIQALNHNEEGTTVNVGLVEAGTSVNTVPSEAEARIDVRVKSHEQADIIIKKIKEICSTTKDERTSVELIGGLVRPPMVKDEKVEALFHIVQEEGKKLGIEIEDTYTGGGSDGCFTSAIGTPTIDGMGPAGGRAHSSEEFLRIETFTERALLLASTIKRLSN